MRLWSVLAAQTSSTVRTARWATRETLPLARNADLAALAEAAVAETAAELAGGACAAVTALSPGDWTLVRFRLWRDRPESAAASDRQTYEVGYVAAS